MLLALFLINVAAGLYVFLPFVGRRNAGAKFYRLIFITSASLAALAAGAHWIANRRDLVIADAFTVGLTVVVWLTLRYPKRVIFKLPAVLLGAAYLAAAILAYDAAVHPKHFAWSIVGALASVALLGSVNLAMLLGHWYLVVRGMAIDPLKRLTILTLVTAVLKIGVVAVSLTLTDSPAVKDIFFWMRAGWGLLGPLFLFPMVWGTVKIRSTMAATGILYVDVVAVVIGEVLGGWLSAAAHIPL